MKYFILISLLIVLSFNGLSAKAIVGVYQENDSVAQPMELTADQWEEAENYGYIGNYKKKLWYKISLDDTHRKMLYFTGVRIHKCRLWVYSKNQFIDAVNFGGYYGNTKYYHGEHLAIDLTKWGDDLTLYFEFEPSLGQMRLPFYLDHKNDYYKFYVNQTVFKSIWLGVLFFFVCFTLVLGIVLKRPLFISIFFVQLGILLFYGLGESGLMLDFIESDIYNAIFFIKGIGILTFSIGNWQILNKFSVFYRKYKIILKISKFVLYYIAFSIIMGWLLWFYGEHTNAFVDSLNVFFQDTSRIAAINIFGIILLYLLFERKNKLVFFISLPMVSYLMYASIFSILMSEGFVNTPKNYLLFVYSFSILEIFLYTGVLFLEYKLLQERAENEHVGKQILNQRTQKWTRFFKQHDASPSVEVFDTLLKEVRDYSHLLNIQEEDVIANFEGSIHKLFKFYAQEDANFQIVIDINDINRANSTLQWEVYKLVYDLLQSFYFNYPKEIFFELRNVKEWIEISLEVEFERDFNKQEMTQIIESEIYDMITQNNKAYLKLLPNNIYVTIVISENEFVSPNLKKILDLDEY